MKILIELLKNILLKKERKDEWTLGSSSTVEKFTDKVPLEEIEKAIETNIRAATQAREKYAKTVRRIMDDPENWHSFKRGA